MSEPQLKNDSSSDKGAASAERAGHEDSEREALEQALQETLEVSPTKAKEFSALLDSRLRVYVEEFFSGPLPHPRILAEYEALSPGLTDRIVRMAERQAEHRQGLEELSVAGNTWMGKAGVICGTSLGLAALGIIALAIVFEAPLEYLGGILTAVAALVGTYLYARRRKAKEADHRLSQVRKLFEESTQPAQRKTTPASLQAEDHQLPRADS